MMRVDWRALLDSARIPWRDRGHNTSRGNINVCCPWCANDTGFHLGIAEEKEAYYCFREPDRHSGRNLLVLLLKLGIARNEAPRLLNAYGSETAVVAPERPVTRVVANKEWERFVSAESSSECVDYLAQRGFANPAVTIRRYDLRYAPEGRWARRLLLPLREAGDVISWTGRAVRENVSPKYLMQSVENPGLLYVPSAARAHTMVVVEGPLDALKVAAGVEGMGIMAVALVGKSLGPSKLWRLHKLSEGCARCLVALDSDVSISYVYNVVRELAGALDIRYVQRWPIHTGYKDPAEMTTRGIVKWLTDARV